MPIRCEAAERLARDLLGTFIQRGLADEESVQIAAHIIESAVKIDESEARIDALLLLKSRPRELDKHEERELREQTV